MNIELYVTNDVEIKVDKALTALSTVTGHIKEVCDRLAPTITFKVEDLASLELCNYVYIPDFRRYYYRGKITHNAKDLEVSFRVDPLMSWSSELKLNSATITRNQFMSNGYLVDNNYKAYAYKECVTRQFPNALDDDTLILITVG